MAKEKPMAKKTPLLDLSTSQDREFILIDTRKCEMRGKHEFSFTDYHRITSIGKTIQKMFDMDRELSEDEASEMKDKLNNVMQFILVDTPIEVLDKINDTQKLEIITAFSKLLSADLLVTLKGAKPEEITPTQN